MKSITKHVVQLSWAVALAACGAVAIAQGAYPNKPIKLVVPYPPGGLGDTMGRELATQLGGRLGQTMIVENKPGASQMIGAEAVAKAPGDGYTLFLGSISSLVLNA
jgi:tripartite-type tricarboxylate transporter receptor subunit TctC